MPGPASVTDFLALVRKSGLLEAHALDDHLRRLGQAGTLPERPEALAGLLVRNGALTRFQAELLLQGRTRGFVIGKYRILEKLGAGGGGMVYLCEHVHMKRACALKVLTTERADDPAVLGRFRREAEAIAALDHVNIVRAYDIDLDCPTPYLVMEYVEGASLQEIVSRQGRLNLARAIDFIRQAAAGLEHAHRAGLVHRDVKPANLLVSVDGVVKLLDLGLARFHAGRGDGLTQEFEKGAILGTADYLAPEQARDSHGVDIRADVYSLGGTFHYLLTGETPFAGGTLNQKLIWHQVRTPPSVKELRSEVPSDLAALILRMLAKQPGERPQTPGEVVQALAPWTRHPLGPPSARELPALHDAVRDRRQGGPPSTHVFGPSTTTGEPHTPPAQPALNLSLPAALAPTAALAPPFARTAPPPLPPAPALPAAIRPAPVPPPFAPSTPVPPVAALAPVPAAPAPPVAAVAATPTAPASPDADWNDIIEEASAEVAVREAALDARRRRWAWAAGLVLAVALVGGALGWWLTRPNPIRVASVVPPVPQRLRAAAQEDGTVTLRWDAAANPAGFLVERSSGPSRSDWQALATVGGDVRRYTDQSALPGRPYCYRVRAVAGEARSPAALVWLAPDFPDGFPPHSMVFNGDAKRSDAGALLLTEAVNNQARSAWYHLPLDVRAFTTTFRFRISPGDQTADGFTFCVQSAGTQALGGVAGGLGYEGIGKSVAVKFDLWDNAGEGRNSTGLFVGGASPVGKDSLDLTPSGINLHGGHVHEVRIAYADRRLDLTVTDAEDRTHVFKTSFTVDVPAAVGGSRAFAGFTGGTGGSSAVQEVLSWTWASDLPPEPLP